MIALYTVLSLLLFVAGMGITQVRVNMHDNERVWRKKSCCVAGGVALAGAAIWTPLWIIMTKHRNEPPCGMAFWRSAVVVVTVLDVVVLAWVAYQWLVHRRKNMRAKAHQTNAIVAALWTTFVWVFLTIVWICIVLPNIWNGNHATTVQHNVQWNATSVVSRTCGQLQCEEPCTTGEGICNACRTCWNGCLAPLHDDYEGTFIGYASARGSLFGLSALVYCRMATGRSIQRHVCCTRCGCTDHPSEEKDDDEEEEEEEAKTSNSAVALDAGPQLTDAVLGSSSKL
jgi:NADH:ubiquinone oxidoreductase subunit 6 (subunit J)